MKKSILTAGAACAALTILPFAPASAGMSAAPGAAAASVQQGAGLVEEVGRRGRRFGRGVAIGAGIVTLGVLGALAAKRAHGEPYYRDRHYRRPYPSYRAQCHRWRRWCYGGNDRACWKFDTRC